MKNKKQHIRERSLAGQYSKFKKVKRVVAAGASQRKKNKDVIKENGLVRDGGE